MWIFSSMGRPQAIRRVVDNYHWIDGRILLTLWRGDPCLGEYLAQKWPPNFEYFVTEAKGNGPTYNDVLRHFPNERQYGFLADDAVLTTPVMLWSLESAAGERNVAYPDDGVWGERLCTMPCIGGDLVRAVGYLAPPNIVHAAIDNVWHEIGQALGCLRYRPELKYTHLHPLFGSAPVDSTYQQATMASFGHMEYLRAWRMGGGLAQAVARARRLARPKKEEQNEPANA